MSGARRGAFQRFRTLLHGHLFCRRGMRDPQVAAGFTVHLFPTGQGNIIGNPIEPVIKLTANPKTARTMSEHIDLMFQESCAGPNSTVPAINCRYYSADGQ